MGGRDVEVDSSRYTNTKVCIGLCLCFSCYESDCARFAETGKGMGREQKEGDGDGFFRMPHLCKL
jgi:hypothetical protein